MKLEQIKTLEIENIGDTEDGYTAGIAEESMPFVFEFMSTQLYSNPIGSLIREITSNCFDSHIEAGVEDPVIISKTYNIEEGYAIEFQDVGVGISPERMLNIFMNYFSSTKRSNNVQIGGFGIGSKTPLAYADLFYITTVFGGLEYEYIYHKGEEKPMLDSLKGYNYEEREVEVWTRWIEETKEWIELEEPEIVTKTFKTPVGTPTDKRNGTTIKVNVVMNDVGRFTEELKFQLAYFDNVWFKGWGITNEYDIYEGKYFKFRSDIDQYKTAVHICLGNVRYTIDGTKVKVPAYANNMPVAIKFEIGEIKVTPSREGIRYTKQDVGLIESRIHLAYEELVALFNRDNPVTDNILRYINIQNNVAKIVFNETKGHGLYVWVGAKLSRTARFKPLEGLALTPPDNLFFRWRIVGYFRKGKVELNDYHGTLSNEFLRDTSRSYCIVPKGQQLSAITLTFIQDKGHRYSDLVLIRKEEVKNKDDYNKVISILKLQGKRKLEEKGDDSKLGSKTKAIMEYNKVIDKIVREKVYDYVKDAPSEEWVAEYKRSIIESSAAYQRKINKKVFMRDITMRGSSMEMKVGDLLKSRRTLIYGYASDRVLLDGIYHTIGGVLTGRVVTDKRKFLIVQVAQGALKEVIHENESVVYCRTYIQGYAFRKILTMIKFRQLFQDNAAHGISEFGRILKYTLKDYQEAYDELEKVSNKYRNVMNYVREEVEIIPELLDPLFKFEDKYKQVISALKDSLIGGMAYGALARPELIAYMKERHVRLKNSFYLKSEKMLEEERVKKEWKRFCINFANVLLETNKIKLLTNKI